MLEVLFAYDVIEYAFGRWRYCSVSGTVFVDVCEFGHVPRDLTNSGSVSEQAVRDHQVMDRRVSS